MGCRHQFRQRQVVGSGAIPENIVGIFACEGKPLVACHVSGRYLSLTEGQEEFVSQFALCFLAPAFFISMIFQVTGFLISKRSEVKHWKYALRTLEI